LIYYENDNGILYKGDILEEIRKIGNSTVDLIITSPPYNLGNNHHTNTKKTQCYDDNLPEDEYQQWQIEIINECYRILKDNGSMFYNHKNRIRKGIQITPYEWLLKTNMIIKQEIVWVNGSYNFDKIRFYPFTERIYWMTKSPKTKLINTLSKHDVFDRTEWKPVGTKNKHTRAFPLQMPLDIISCFPESEIILDPFMGSGTVALASEQLNKKWLGIELDKEFCDLTIDKVVKIN